MNGNSIIFTMYQRAMEHNHRVFMFVSANPQEGTTYCIKRVAKDMSEYFKNVEVAVIDLNVHNPELSRQASGSNDHLEVTYEAQIDFSPTSDRGLMETFPRIKPDSDNGMVGMIPLATTIKPGELWSSHGNDFTIMLKTLHNQFDFVLVDCSPLMKYQEALFAARYMDGVFVVVEAGKTRRQVVQKALEQLYQANADVIGVIMNKRSYHIPKWLYRRIF